MWWKTIFVQVRDRLVCFLLGQEIVARYEQLGIWQAHTSRTQFIHSFFISVFLDKVIYREIEFTHLTIAPSYGFILIKSLTKSVCKVSKIHAHLKIHLRSFDEREGEKDIMVDK